MGIVDRLDRGAVPPCNYTLSLQLPCLRFVIGRFSHCLTKRNSTAVSGGCRAVIAWIRNSLRYSRPVRSPGNGSRSPDRSDDQL